MELEDQMFLDDDLDILHIIEFGFPRQMYVRPSFINDMDDMNFYRRFRFTKDTVMYILGMIEGSLTYNNDLNNSVSPVNQLLTALAFYASNGHQISIGEFMGMNQVTVSRIVAKVSRAIADLRSRFIKMPSNDEERTILQTNFYKISKFPRVIGCIDCTHIKVLSPGGEDGEVYMNRKSYFSLNVQVVCDSDLKISNIVSRWPGSVHDATIFNNSRLRTRFEAGEFQNGLLLGDSGYPLKNYLLTPLLHSNSVGEERYNMSHIKTRNTIEGVFGVWKRRFPVLCYGLRCRIDNIMPLIVATAVLHNIAREMHNDDSILPTGFNTEPLDYLVEQGQINSLGLQQNYALGLRSELSSYFANL